MSILIKGMEMPNYCYECPFHSKIYNGIESQWWCSLLNKIAHDDEGHKTKECPLVEVPDTQTEKKSLNGDVIGRQAAIDEIDEWIKAFLENGHKESAADACLIQDGIIQLPSAQPEQRWIPCSERLPDDLEEVNITFTNLAPEPYYDFIKGKCFTGSAVLYKGEWYWYSSITVDVLKEYGRYESEKIDEGLKIVAWMPLPEPYGGEQE